MINQALFDVVKNQLAIGVSEAEVKEFLRRRGTSEPEIQELFDALVAQTVSIEDIPVVQPAPVTAPPVIASDTPTHSEAHGIVRPIPPLPPSVPFNPIIPEQRIAVQPVVPSVPTVAPVVSEVAVPATITPEKKKTLILMGVGIVGLALVVFGGYFVYSSYFASPERVIDTMISRLRDVRSGEFSVDVTAVTDGIGELVATSTTANPFLKAFTIEGPVTLALHASGTVDLRDEQKPAVAFQFTSTMDKWPMGDFVLGAEYRSVERINYLKISSVPDLGFVSLSFLKNQWFKATDSEAKTQVGMGTSATSDTVIPEISQSQRDALVSAWKTNRFLTVDKTLRSEDVDGVSTHHYALTFDKESFKRWNDAVGIALRVTNADSNAIAFNDLLQRTTIKDLQIWVGKRDGLPHKVTAIVVIADERDPQKTSEITLTMMGNKFNSVLDVTAPEGAKSVEEALQGIFGQMLTESTVAPAVTPQERNKQRENNIQAIMSAVRLNMQDNGGTFLCPLAGALPTKATFIGKTGYDIEPCITPRYMPGVPKDPTKGTSDMTGYSIFYTPSTKKITIRAPYAELGKKISLTK